MHTVAPHTPENKIPPPVQHAPHELPMRLDPSTAVFIVRALFDLGDEYAGSQIGTVEIVGVARACGYDFALACRARELREDLQPGVAHASIMRAILRAADEVIAPLVPVLGPLTSWACERITSGWSETHAAERAAAILERFPGYPGGVDAFVDAVSAEHFGNDRGADTVDLDTEVRQLVRVLGGILEGLERSMSARAAILAALADRFEVEVSADEDEIGDAAIAAHVAEALRELVGDNPSAFDFVRGLDLTVIESERFGEGLPDAMLFPARMIVGEAGASGRDVLFLRPGLDETARDVATLRAVACDRLRAEAVASLPRAVDRVMELLGYPSGEEGDEDEGKSE